MYPQNYGNTIDVYTYKIPNGIINIAINFPGCLDFSMENRGSQFSPL
jgi:hypothetical protein